MRQDMVTSVNKLVLDDYHRITQRFVQEAITEWDTIGSGCFALWIQWVVASKWLELIQSN